MLLASLPMGITGAEGLGQSSAWAGKRRRLLRLTGLVGAAILGTVLLAGAGRLPPALEGSRDGGTPPLRSQSGNPPADGGSLGGAKIDDAQLGKLKRTMHFQDRLDVLEELMKVDPRKKLRYAAEFASVKEEFLKARTLNELGLADDNLQLMEADFYR